MTQQGPMVPSSFDRGYDDVSLVDTLIVLWRYKVVVLGLPLVAAAVALALSARATPVFEATSKVEARYPNGAAVNVQVIESIKTRLTSLRMAEHIAASNAVAINGRNLDATAVLRSVTAQGVRNSPVILIRAALPDPNAAAKLANLVAESATSGTGLEDPADANGALKLAESTLEQSREALERFYDRPASAPRPDAASQPYRVTKEQMELDRLRVLYQNALSSYAAAVGVKVRLSIADRALPPSAPISPQPRRAAALAFAVTLFAAVLLVIVTDAVRARLRTLHG